MEISEKLVDDILVVSLGGRLFDPADVQVVRDIFQEAIDLGKPEIVVNLESLESISSIGLGGLIGGLKRCRDAGGNLVIANAESLERYEAVGIQLVFDMHDSVEQAIKSFKAGVS